MKYSKYITENIEAVVNEAMDAEVQASIKTKACWNDGPNKRLLLWEPGGIKVYCEWSDTGETDEGDWPEIKGLDVYVNNYIDSVLDDMKTARPNNSHNGVSGFTIGVHGDVQPYYSKDNPAAPEPWESDEIILATLTLEDVRKEIENYDE